MKYSRLEICMILVMLAVGLTFGFAWYQASAHDRNKKPEPVEAISESIHITKADGTKSLGQLIREQSAITIPDRAISLAQFTVDAGHDALIFPRNGFQPEGFELAIAAGDDKTLKLPRLPINAPEALDFFLAKTTGECNFIVYIEFYPK